MIFTNQQMEAVFTLCLCQKTEVEIAHSTGFSLALVQDILNTNRLHFHHRIHSYHHWKAQYKKHAAHRLHQQQQEQHGRDMIDAIREVLGLDTLYVPEESCLKQDAKHYWHTKDKMVEVRANSAEKAHRHSTQETVLDVLMGKIS
jgi:hypothetical protein